MIVEDITLTRIDASTLKIEWTGTANYYSYIIMDGSLVLSNPLRLSTTSKSATISANTDAHDIFVIESAQEFNSTTHHESENKNPVIQWLAVENAEIYLLYVDAVLLVSVPETNESRYSYTITNPLDQGWHTIQVKAVDSIGRESEAKSEVLLVRRYKEKSDNVSIVETASNTFTITIS